VVGRRPPDASRHSYDRSDGSRSRTRPGSRARFGDRPSRCRRVRLGTGLRLTVYGAHGRADDQQSRRRNDLPVPAHIADLSFRLPLPRRFLRPISPSSAPVEWCRRRFLHLLVVTIPEAEWGPTRPAPAECQRAVAPSGPSDRCGWLWSRRLNTLTSWRLDVLVLAWRLDVLIIPCRLHVLVLQYGLGLLRRAQTRGHRHCDDRAKSYCNECLHIYLPFSSGCWLCFSPRFFVPALVTRFLTGEMLHRFDRARTRKTTDVPPPQYGFTREACSP
jgi:hypothetical protein